MLKVPRVRVRVNPNPALTLTWNRTWTLTLTLALTLTLILTLTLDPDPDSDPDPDPNSDPAQTRIRTRTLTLAITPTPTLTLAWLYPYYIMGSFSTPLAAEELNNMWAKQTWKQCKEALSATIDDVNLMKCHSVYYFFTLLQFTLGTLDKSRLQQKINNTTLLHIFI